MAFVPSEVSTGLVPRKDQIDAVKWNWTLGSALWIILSHLSSAISRAWRGDCFQGKDENKSYSAALLWLPSWVIIVSTVLNLYTVIVEELTKFFCLTQSSSWLKRIPIV